MSWISHDYAIYYDSFKMDTIRSIHRYNDLRVVCKVLNHQLIGYDFQELFPRRQINKLKRRLRLIVEENYNTPIRWNSTKARLRKLWNGVATSYNTDVRVTQFKRLAKDLSHGLVQ